MRVNPPALKHGISEPGILHAAESWAYASTPDDAMPAKQFVLGFDSSHPSAAVSVAPAVERSADRTMAG